MSYSVPIFDEEFGLIYHIFQFNMILFLLSVVVSSQSGKMSTRASVLQAYQTIQQTNTIFYASKLLVLISANNLIALPKKSSDVSIHFYLHVQIGRVELSKNQLFPRNFFKCALSRSIDIVECYFFVKIFGLFSDKNTLKCIFEILAEQK